MSSTVKDKGAVAVSSSTVVGGIEEMAGGWFAARTSSGNEVSPLNSPSVTVRVMTVLPVWPGIGARLTVRWLSVAPARIRMAESR